MTPTWVEAVRRSLERPSSSLTANLVVVAAYAALSLLAVVSARVGLLPVVHLGAALAFLALATCRLSVVPGVLAGAALWYVLQRTPITAALIGGFGDFLAGILGYLLIRFAQPEFDWTLSRRRDAGLTLVVVGLLAVLHGLFQLATSPEFIRPSSTELADWLTSSALSAVGALLLVPLALTWAAAPRVNREAVRALATGVITFAVLLAVPRILATLTGSAHTSTVEVIASLPIAMAVASYFDVRGAALVNVFAGLAVFLRHGVGFAGSEAIASTLDQTLVDEVHVAVFAVATLWFAAHGARVRSESAEQAANERRYRGLAQMSVDWYWEQDAKFRFTLVTEGAAAVGLTPEETHGRRLWDLPVVSSPVPMTAQRRLMESHRPFHDLLLQCRSDASEPRYALISGEPEFNEAGKFTGYRGVGHDVTAQKRAEEALRNSEQRYSSVFHNAAASILTLAFDGVGRLLIESCNASAELLFDRRADELIGQLPEEVLPPAAAQIIGERLKACVSSGNRITEEHSFVVGAAVKHVVITFVPGRRKGSGIDQLLIFAIDITEQKRVERRMRESEQLFRRVFDASPIPMLIVSYASRRYIEVNEAWSKCFGYSRDEVVGRTALELRIWADQLGDDETWYQMVRAGKTRNVERRLRTKTGHTVDAIISAELVVLEGEERIINSMVDITVQKAIERQLRVSERRFRDFAEAAGEFVWEVGPDGRYTYVSNRVEQVLGYKPLELLGKTPFETILPPEESERVAGWLEKNAAPDGSYRNLQHRALTRSGATIWLLANAVAAMDEGGRTIALRGTALDITERKLAEQRIEDLATHDPLTGLPNRLLLQDRLQKAIAGAARAGSQVAVMFIDLDHFKHVNDSMGHHFGDLLLKEVAQRLAGVIRKQDTLSRLGGDEFVVVLEGLRASVDAAQVAGKILQALSQGFDLEGQRVFANASMGISLYPADASDVGTLMRHADTAMYAAKANGRRSYQFFSTEMNEQAAQRAKLESDLRHAVARNEFRVLFEPRATLLSNEISAMQVLLRWKHPSGLLVTPDRFSVVADELGLMPSIGQWVLDAAAAQAKQWSADSTLRVPVGCKVSSRQFMHRLADVVLEVLERHGLEPRLLEIAVDEATLMRDVDHSREVVTKLRDLGCHVIVDDFGAGYSSLQYLRHVPVTGVKIHASLVNDLERSRTDRTILRGLIEMLCNLALKVIAEGIATKAELDWLKEAGCHEYCGTLLVPALPSDELEQRLRQGGTVVRFPSSRRAG
jgi:diguanylate cyclase (GGDEF)-like protein/PAS domain S-box-containing protein